MYTNWHIHTHTCVCSCLLIEIRSVCHQTRLVLHAQQSRRTRPDRWSECKGSDSGRSTSSGTVRSIEPPRTAMSHPNSKHWYALIMHQKGVSVLQLLSHVLAKFTTSANLPTTLAMSMPRHWQHGVGDLPVCVHVESSGHLSSYLHLGSFSSPQTETVSLQPRELWRYRDTTK